LKNISLYGIRLVKEKSASFVKDEFITTPVEVKNCAMQILDLADRTEEVFAMLTLDTKNKITGVFEVSVGSLNQSLVHPREIFKRAIVNNANSIILLHNHPSGNPEPSQDDIATTQRIYECGKLLGIHVLDHVILGDDNKFYSFKEKGVI